ncbi:3-hydroxyacyl-CoA dehydrogenase NAD-binding domain-containing protein (plasmid) [Bradyrhizobium sp. CB82]|uniref:3-hydroxyacyl-CoA dehydrogenase family protein n=1 Tax=Bradyrhizobium sp. CB82 TaxID=3039159 RepID=UPI0024B17CAB|nr:3-hydroxyacyl-CoA dehydrogenase NAD-binding domain-containing protein [Bradyrhizobium sp. CB82]WFU46145.1 3-hydroxyacyl-CoA dehydrogenase NAD-binding domain-containing protein [Bradyrhizobium sp. CB82]
MQTVAIVGTGSLSTELGKLALTAGLSVLLVGPSRSVVTRDSELIRAALGELVSNSSIPASKLDLLLSHLSVSDSYEALIAADVVFDVSTTGPEASAELLRRIDPFLAPDAVVASTTCLACITRLASVISRPDRFVGMHFLQPIGTCQLVEIVRALQTSDAACAIAETLASMLGKTPIAVRNTPGFIVARILALMLNEAFFILGESDVCASDIDEAVRLAFSCPFGPFEFADSVGLDVVLSAVRSLHEDLGDPKYRPAPSLKEMVAAGYIGQRSGRGVYRY